MSMQYLSAPCGTGKSKAMFEIIKKEIMQYGNHHIIVQETIILQNQSLEIVRKFTDEVLQINSEITEGNLIDALTSALHGKYKKVLIISEKLLFKLQNESLLKDWKIWMDDCTSFYKISEANLTGKDILGTIELYRNIFINRQRYIIDSNLPDDNEINRKYLSVQIDNGAVLTQDGKLILEKYNDFSCYDHIVLNASALDDSDVEFDDKGEPTNPKKLMVIGWYDLARFARHGISMVFMANDFTKTQMYKYYQHIFTAYPHNISWNTSNHDRLKVKYFYETGKNEPVGLSKGLTKTANGAEAVYNVKKWLIDNIRTEFYFTDNTFVPSQIMKDEYRSIDRKLSTIGNGISPNQKGINSLVEYDTSVFLASMNLNPNYAEILGDVLDLTYEDARHDMQTETLIQFAYRGCIRDYSMSTDMVLYVFDDLQAISTGALPCNIEHIDIGLSELKGDSGRPAVYDQDLPKNLLNAFSSWKTSNEHLQDMVLKLRFDKWEKKQQQDVRYSNMDISCFRRHLRFERPNAGF